MPQASVLRRNNVNVTGSGKRAIMFAHGFGCDQAMWATCRQELRARFPSRPVRLCRSRAERSQRLLRGALFEPVGLCRRRGRDRPYARAGRSRIRRPFGQRDDRCPRHPEGARHVLRPGDGRPLAALHQRRGLSSAASRASRSTNCSNSSPRITWLVGRDGARDHGQSRPARTGRPAREQLLQRPIRRSRATSPGSTFLSDNRADLAADHGRTLSCNAATTSSRRSKSAICPRRLPDSEYRPVSRDRPLPEPQRARGSNRGDS